MLNCHDVGWPGYRTTAWHQAAEQFSTHLWFGSLVDGMRDASGQMYMRNRYYDPATGQFTQADPIGLAGGLNAYGFAAGDPISFADPYGLSADTLDVAEDLQDDVDKCVAASSNCKNLVEAAQNDTARWEMRSVNALPAACHGMVGACTVRTGRNGVMYFTENQFGAASVLSGVAQHYDTLIPHELAHALICGVGGGYAAESCAIGIENYVRADLSYPLRKLPY